MTQVTHELGRIADTLGGGISDLGRSRLAGERQRTQGTRLDYELGRNKQYDERAERKFALEEPRLRRDSLEAEAEIRKGQRPASWGAEMGDDVYKNMVFARTIAPKLMKIYDADPDMEGGQFKLRRKDGSVIRQIDRDLQAEAEAILSSYKVASTYKDQVQRIEEKEKRLNAQGVPALDPAYEKLKLNKTRAQTVLDSPERMIRVLEGQLAQLSKYGHYPEDIKRIKGEIRIEQAKLMTPRELAKENRAIESHKEKMKLIAIQMKNAEKVAKKAGKTTKKLSPGDTAKKQALLKEYTYNLKIQEKFKTQGVGGVLEEEGALTQQDYDDVVSKNIDIMNQLEELGVQYDMGSTADQLISRGREMQGKGAQGGGTQPTVYRNKKTGDIMVVDADGNKKAFDQNGNPVKTAGAAIPETRPKVKKPRTVDTSHRGKVIQNPDGTTSSERTITVGIDGKYYNIPSLVDGVQLSEGEAVRRFKAGDIKAVGVADTLKAALKMAGTRTEMLGRESVSDTSPADLKQNIKQQINKYQSKSGALAPSIAAKKVAESTNKIIDKIEETYKIKPPTQKEIDNLVKKYMR